MSTTFSAVPVIDFSALQNDETKAQTLSKLREAVFGVGFLYLINTGLEGLIRETHDKLPDVFALPPEQKEQCNMLNSPAFLGYTRLGAETTASQTDLREQFDFGTPIMKPWREGDPFWQKLEAPSQYPNEEIKNSVQRYMSEMSILSKSFLRYVGESLSLAPSTFEPFLGNMDRLKLVKYPPADPGSQGVGPHKDSTGLFTFLSQDTVGGLQVLNKSGEWIDAPPIEGSLVVNIQQGFEAVTGGVCSATTHRVIAPTTRTRYSIPFFLAVRLDLTLEQLKESAAYIVGKIPVSEDKKRRAVDVPSEFLSPLYSCFGEAQLRNRIISHPDVGRKWYPELYERYSQHKLK